MKRLNEERRKLQVDGQAAIMRRNDIKFADVGTNGFLLQESVRVSKNGVETTNYKLFKLVDEETVTLSVDVNKEIEEGIKGHSGGNNDGQQKSNNQSAI